MSCPITQGKCPEQCSNHRAQRSQVCPQFKISTTRDPAPSCDSICLQIVPSWDIRRTQCLWALRYVNQNTISPDDLLKALGHARLQDRFRRSFLTPLCPVFEPRPLDPESCAQTTRPPRLRGRGGVRGVLILAYFTYFVSNTFSGVKEQKFES